MNTPTQHQPNLADLPALASLRLTESELGDVAARGFLSSEKRGEKTYYKLRFRVAGKQRVKYVACNELDAVRSDLDKLQAGKRLRRQLTRSAREASQLLHQIKSKLQPVLEAHGYAFHGLAIHRRRNGVVKAVETRSLSHEGQ